MVSNDRPGGTLTVLEIARRYHLNPETVRRWAREEKVPAQRVGNMLFFRADDISALVRRDKQVD